MTVVYTKDNPEFTDVKPWAHRMRWYSICAMCFQIHTGLELSWNIKSVAEFRKAGSLWKNPQMFSCHRIPFLLYCLWRSLLSTHKYTPIVAVLLSFKNGSIFCLAQEKREMRKKGGRKEEKEMAVLQAPTVLTPLTEFFPTALWSGYNYSHFNRWEQRSSERQLYRKSCLISGRAVI